MPENISLPPAVGEQYEITQPIERGAAAFMALGHNRLTGEEVFIKVREGDEEGSARARTYNEANHLASLHHPRIPQLIDAGSFDTNPYLITERMSGSSAPEYWLRDNVGHELAATLCLSALEVLQYVHEQDMVHRDIKEANMVMRWGGEVALIDFELALDGEQRSARQRLSESAEPLPYDARVTGVGRYVGTATHISPEQIKGDEATKRSDLYSMGTVMYVLTYGRPPFSGDSNQVMSKKTVQDVNFWPPDRKAPYELIEVMERATQVRPEDRYESAAAMAEAVERYLHPADKLTLAA